MNITIFNCLKELAQSAKSLSDYFLPEANDGSSF